MLFSTLTTLTFPLLFQSSLHLHSYGFRREFSPPSPSNRVPAYWLGLRRGAFTCVGWQVTLCDPMWQVMSRSCEMEYPLTAIRSLLYLFLNFIPIPSILYVTRLIAYVAYCLSLSAFPSWSSSRYARKLWQSGRHHTISVSRKPMSSQLYSPSHETAQKIKTNKRTTKILKSRWAWKSECDKQCSNK